MASVKSFLSLSYGSFRISHHKKIIASKDLEEKVNIIVNNLISTGLNQGDVVGILSENSVELVLSVLALWHAGAVPMPINTRLTDKEIFTIIRSIQCAAILADDANMDRSLVTKTRVHNLLDLTKGKVKRPHKRVKRMANDPALIILTSGSTGVPKGVQLTFKNLASSAIASNEFFHHRKEDKWLASLPFYHIGGFSVITRSFLFGTELIIQDDLDQDAIYNSIKKYHPSFASFVPTQLRRMIKKHHSHESSLRRVLIGGGFIDPEMIRSAIKGGWPVAKSYGSTETASFIAVLPPENFHKKPESAGVPLKGNKIFIVDEKRDVLKSGQLGEILVKSPSVALKYINDEKLTSLKFNNGAYFTGDYGYLDEDGYLYVISRKDDFIISGGEKINPHEVESAIIEHPQIEDAAVIGTDDPEWGQMVTAVIVPKGQATITLKDLREFLIKQLASYKHPKKLITVKSIPRTALGKVKIRELQKIVARL